MPTPYLPTPPLPKSTCNVTNLVYVCQHLFPGKALLAFSEHRSLDQYKHLIRCVPLALVGGMSESGEGGSISINISSVASP